MTYEMAGYRLMTLYKKVAGGWLSAKESLKNGRWWLAIGHGLFTKWWLVAGYRLRTLYKMVAGVLIKIPE
jgi:hypothetical protein